MATAALPRGRAPHSFDQTIRKTLGGELCARGLEYLQVNVGFRCNQSCAHCHVGASPARTEMMEWPTMRRIVEVAEAARCRWVDITGGAPELNPHLRAFIAALRGSALTVLVRTNLTVLLEPGLEGLPEFFHAHEVRLAASLPCYLEENVRAQRGAGVYEKSIAAMRRLNALGYGGDPRWPLDLVYNPGGAFLPPDEAALEADYRRELAERFGVRFTRLRTLVNMPIGRFGDLLRRERRDDEYQRLLTGAFNPKTVDGLMCRRQLSIGWDGALYDCDFNLALGFPVNHGAPAHLRDFDLSALAGRRIVTGEYCFGCTAGSGSSCAGALVRGA